VPSHSSMSPSTANEERGGGRRGGEALLFEFPSMAEGGEKRNTVRCISILLPLPGEEEKRKMNSASTRRAF